MTPKCGVTAFEDRERSNIGDMDDLIIKPPSDDDAEEERRRETSVSKASALPSAVIYEIIRREGEE